MTGREVLDQEIYVLGRILRDDQAGLKSEKTSAADHLLLRLQIGIRGAMNARLLERRDTLRQ